MDYFNGNGTEENLSLQDMIECDIRSNFNEQMGNNDGLGSQSQGVDQLSATVGGMDSMLNYGVDTLGRSTDIIESIDMTDGKGLSNLDMNWLQTVNLSSLQDLCRPENTDPNLMVNPQTGMPVSQSQHEQTVTTTNAMLSQAVNESAVRSALLRTATPEQTHFITVSPAMIQQQPQYLTQQQQPSPSNQGPPSPSPIRQHLQNGQQHRQSPLTSYPNISSPQPMIVQSPQKSHPSKVVDESSKSYPKPVYSYSCLIAMALKNCDTGCLPVSEIYNFMTENFPYFKTAPDGWKNSVRHNLSLNKCFEKIENPKSTGTTKKGCLWAMNPAKIEKMEEEIAKWRKKDPIAIKRSMAKPEVLELLEQGQGGRSPHRSLSTPTTTSNNNNIKVVTQNPPLTTQAGSGGRMSQVITNISANVNVIEIKPFKSEAEQLTNLTTDDLNLLDSNTMTLLDPIASDLTAFQGGMFGAVSGIFDDLNGEDLNLEDLHHTGSPLSFTFSSTGGLTASPIHFQAGASGAVTPTLDDKAALQSSLNLYNCSSATPTSSPASGTTKYSISRTVSAQT